jgi:hypothetical protein
MRSALLILFLLTACSQDKPDAAVKAAHKNSNHAALASLDCSQWNFVTLPIVKQASVLKDFPELKCHINQAMGDPAIDCTSPKGFLVGDMKASFVIYSHPMGSDYSYVELNEKAQTVRAHLQKLHGVPDIENQIDGLVWISLHTDGRERRTTLKVDAANQRTNLSCNISPPPETNISDTLENSSTAALPSLSEQPAAAIDVVLPPEITGDVQKNIGACISGDIQYPMRKIPPMRICVVSEENKTHTCVETKAGMKTYAIQGLSAGNYVVIAEAQGGKLPIAAHVAPVKCIRAPCPDLPSTIAISADTNLTNIHINGFYDARSDFPKMPEAATKNKRRQ